ncbi:carbamoyl phosphate synthase large subunit, partial [Streptomyces sp. NPDC005728]
SALASKATGFPIAKIAAKLAVGHTLDEIPNDIAEQPPGHVVVRAGDVATGIGRTFAEALNKALRARDGEPAGPGASGRAVLDAARADPWLAEQLALIEEVADEISAAPGLDPGLLAEAKRHGFSDARIAGLRSMQETAVREVRHALGIRPVHRALGGGEGRTPCLSSSYEPPPELSYGESAHEAAPVARRARPAVIILGPDPVLDTQSGAFAHAAVHAAAALRATGHETVVVTCDPAPLSAGHGSVDRLHFAPLTVEDVLEVVHAERQSGPVAGVVAQFGGAGVLRLAQGLRDSGVTILGTPPDAVRLAGDPGAFHRLLRAAGLSAPKHGTASSATAAKEVAAEIEYPVTVVRPDVPGGAGPEVVHDEGALASWLARHGAPDRGRPLLIGQVLRDAVEVGVDALFDGTELYLGGVMEHVGEPGTDSGDSACVLPPVTLGGHDIARLRTVTEAVATGLGVRGPLSVRYALAGGVVHVLGAEPYASGTVPFTSKATAVPLARAAGRIVLGATVAELRGEGLLRKSGDGGTLPPDAPISVRQSVLTAGDVMGIGADFGAAYATSRSAAQGSLPTKGRALLCVAGRDARSMVFPARELAAMGFELLTAAGTADVLRRNGVGAGTVRTTGESAAARLVRDGQVDLVVITHRGDEGPPGSHEIRAAAAAHAVPCLTTVRALAAAVQGIDRVRRPQNSMPTRSLQEWQSATAPITAH